MVTVMKIVPSRYDRKETERLTDCSGVVFSVRCAATYSRLTNESNEQNERRTSKANHQDLAPPVG